MSFDYTPLVSTAQELIALFGRDVVLQRRTTASASPTRPWGPPAASGAGSLSVTVKAVFLGLSRGSFANVSVGINGGNQTGVEGKTSRVLIAAQPSIAIEIGPEFLIVDGARRWEIARCETIRPGGSLIYFDCEVSA